MKSRGQSGLYNGVTGHILLDGAEILTLPIEESGSAVYSLTKSFSADSTLDFAIDTPSVA